MTFRELLKGYKNGSLPKDQQEEVKAEIEKHEAISDYLYEDTNIPGLKDFTQTDNTPEKDQEAEQFTKLIHSTIRRSFIKIGAVMSTIVLAMVLTIIFVLPPFVSSFYYNPNEVVGKSKDGIETRKMALDLSVYSELYLPESYRNNVIAESEGYGKYQVTIPQNSSYDGRFTTVVGKLNQGKLTLYNPDIFRFPSVNAFIVPQERQPVFQGIGAAGTREEAYAALDELKDNTLYKAYFSLDHLMDYHNFYQRMGADAHWVAIYTGSDNFNHMGVHLKIGGLTLDWDRENYPLLSQLDNDSPAKSFEIKEDPALMQTHFLSMLSYMKDHPEITELFEHNNDNWDEIIDHIKTKGMQVYGFTAVADKETILKISKGENISYVYTEPLP